MAARKSKAQTAEDLLEESKRAQGQAVLKALMALRRSNPVFQTLEIEARRDIIALARGGSGMSLPWIYDQIPKVLSAAEHATLLESYATEVKANGLLPITRDRAWLRLFLIERGDLHNVFSDSDMVWYLRKEIVRHKTLWYSIVRDLDAREDEVNAREVLALGGDGSITLEDFREMIRKGYAAAGIPTLAM